MITKRLVQIRHFMLLLYLFTLSFAHAQTLLLENADDDYHMRCVISMARDTSTTQAVEHMMMDSAINWYPMDNDEYLNLGYVHDAIWLRVALDSTDDMTHEYFLELLSTRLDYVDWYVTDDTAIFRHRISGNLQEVEKSRLNLRNPVLHVELPAQGRRIIYARFFSETAIQIALRLMNAETYVKQISRSEAVQSSLYGCMAGLLLLTCLFAWASNQKVNYLYACGMFMLTLLFPIMGGYYTLFFLPWREFWAHDAVIMLSNAGYAILVLHCSLFFNFKTNMRMIHRVVWGYVVLVAVMTTVVLFLPFWYGIDIIICIIMLSTLIMPVITLIAAFQGNKAVRFYLPANLLFWIYSWTQMLFYYGIIHFHIVPEFSGMICIIVSVFVFFLSTVQYVVILRKEKEATQERELQLQQEMMHSLEMKVQQRTQELQQAKDEAEQANQAKTNFFSQISHDLRAPLNWLIGLADSLWLESKELSLSDEFIAYLQHIKKGGYYLSQLLNNIMDINAIEAGHMKARNESFDLRHWADSLEAIARAVAKSCDVDLVWNYVNKTSESYMFNSDPVKLSQILMNLVHNAIKFSPVKGQVSVTLSCHSNVLTMQVRDEGEGFAEDIDRYFQSYYQVQKKKDTCSKGWDLVCIL